MVGLVAVLVASWLVASLSACGYYLVALRVVGFRGITLLSPLAIFVSTFAVAYCSLT